MKTRKDIFIKDIRADEGFSVRPVFTDMHDKGILINSNGAVRFVGRDVVVAMIRKYSVTGEVVRFDGTDWHMVFDRDRAIEIEGHHYVFGEVLLLSFEQENLLKTHDLSDLNVFPAISRCLDNIVEIWVDEVCMRAHQLD